MAVTQHDIDNLNAAIARGVRSVTIGGQTLIYSTAESLIKARDDLQAQLNRQEAQTRPRKHKQMRLYHAGRGDER